MIRYESGPKKKAIEDQISVCSNIIQFSQLSIVVLALIMILAWAICLNFFNPLSEFNAIIIILLLVIIASNYKDLKELEIELDKVKDDVVKDRRFMTDEEWRDELIDDMAKEIIERALKSENASDDNKVN